ncbi:MAG: hypothetical protein ACOC83_06380, partial [Gemmatimonadota bacterium]
MSPAERDTDGDEALLVDGHTHFHPEYPAARFLDAAARNLRRWAPAEVRGGTPPDSGASLCLLFADPAHRDSLAALSGA